jgi:hypothetical protein
MLTKPKSHVHPSLPGADFFSPLSEERSKKMIPWATVLVLCDASVFDVFTSSEKEYECFESIHPVKTVVPDSKSKKQASLLSHHAPAFWVDGYGGYNHRLTPLIAMSLSMSTFICLFIRAETLLQIQNPISLGNDWWRSVPSAVHSELQA